MHYSILLFGLFACRTPVKTTDTGSPVMDVDGDGYTADEDCNDSDASINPGVIELCNGIDDNCDGSVDEEVTNAYYTDADGDGFGDPTAVVEACEAPDGTVPTASDCDDTDDSVFPGAPERCDEIDNDCDTEIDEDIVSTWYADGDSDGFGDPEAPIEACDPPLGYSADSSDCDDTSADISPDAVEICDEIDNDCDGDIDEEVTSVFYADVDGDGYGDDTDTLEACDVPEGYSAERGDCDDTNFDAFPGAPERCDGADNDCDGQTDEADAIDAAMWYADADADGYGDPSVATASCDQPSGTVADATDCDDAAAAVNPAATETCNAVDDDCDGDIDDADASLDTSTATQWFTDADSDGYGDATSSTIACAQPSATVTDSTDCDDDAADVNPAATEICNAIDDDCDGDIDDDDASLDTSTATQWFTDADSDGYGDATSSVFTCVQPSGTVTDDTDCDDADDTAYPGAVELRDGADNDCDGTADDSLHLGSGIDGPLSVSAEVNLTTSATSPRTVADGVAYAVSALGTDTITTDSSPAGIAAGDEVLLINLQGTTASHASVGQFEFASVVGVSGNTVSLAQNIQNRYGESSNTDLTDQIIIVQRVPQYTDVTVSTTGAITANAWDGLTGGVLAFRASGTVTIASGGYIDMSEAGYAGGVTGQLGYNCDSYQGESYVGPGDGEHAGTCAAYNEATGEWAANGGGGGAHICGGGGEYAGGATAADSWTGGSATPAEAGDTYGTSDLSTLFFGSGGGGVWNGDTSCIGSGPGSGGDGGGIVYIGANIIEFAGSNTVLSIGGSTTACARGSWTYGAGGGAGGSIWLVADEVDLAADSIAAEGGGGEARNIRAGGDGGDGRVRIDCTVCNGETQGTAAADAALNDASAPDVGYSSTP